MYLSRLDLQPRDRDVRHDLGDLQALHSRVMSGFPEADAVARSSHGVLWRLEAADRHGRMTLLVQSRTPPDWSRLPPGFLVSPPSTKPIDTALEAIAVGARLRFRLVANPTVKVDTLSGPDGARRNGRRVPVRGEVELLGWLVRKAAGAGFSVGPDVDAAGRSVVVRQLGDGIGWRGPRGAASRVTFRGVAFDGVLVVTEPSRLLQSVEAGVGSGKAYGFGLLSIAPAGPAP